MRYTLKAKKIFREHILKKGKAIQIKKKVERLKREYPYGGSST